MTHLRKMMLEELQRRNYAETTISSYIRIVEDFSRRFQRPPDRLGPQHIRELHHASVSTPRSSNRTCGCAASGSRRRLTQSLTPLHVTPPATFENSLGVIRLIANLPSVVASCVRLQLGPLPSTGVTWLPRYYEPLRHPSRPGLSLTSCQLIHTAITAGTSRVVYGPPLPTCRRQYPGRTDGILFAHTIPSTSAFPEIGAGRLLH